MTATRPNFTHVSSLPYLLSTTLVEVQVDGSSRGRRRRDMSPTLIRMGNLRLVEALVLAVALALAAANREAARIRVHSACCSRRPSLLPLQIAGKTSCELYRDVQRWVHDV